MGLEVKLSASLNLYLKIRHSNGIYWDRSTFNYRFIFFLLELFCDQYWKNFFESLEIY